MKSFLNLRILYLICIILTICLGLASRSEWLSKIQFIRLYLGDALWALMVYFIVCLMQPKLIIWRQICIAIAFCFIIELSQLYQADWINHLRQSRLGGLILGFGFRAVDLLAYSVGVITGAGINHCYLYGKTPK